jgi:ribosomal protein L37AE/L43A
MSPTLQPPSLERKTRGPSWPAIRNDDMTESRSTATPQVCETCADETARRRTMYVHLCSGAVQEVAGVSEVHLTETGVVFLRGKQARVVFPRRDVYFACCDPDTPPFPS